MTKLFTILCAYSNINKMKKFDSMFKETCNSQISFYNLIENSTKTIDL